MAGDLLPGDLGRSASDTVKLTSHYLEKWKKEEIHKDTFEAIS